MPNKPRLLLPRDTFKAGLAAAAKLLNQTADDFDEIADRNERYLNAHLAAHGSRVLGVANTRAEINESRGKARLFRGQAGHILELKQ